MKVNNLDWLEIAEYLSLVGAVVGSLAAVVLQQIIYAAVPLSLTLLLNLFNRHRTEQLSRQNLSILMTQLDGKLTSLKTLMEWRVDALKTDIAHLNQEAQNIQGNSDLKGNVTAMQQLQGQIVALEQSVAAIAIQLDNLTQVVNLQSQRQPGGLSTVGPSGIDRVYPAQDPRTAPQITPEGPLDTQEVLKRYHW